MARTTAATRELSILISEDLPGAQILVKQAIDTIGEEIDVNMVFSSEQLLDFLLKTTFPSDTEAPLLPDMIVANYSEPFRDLKIIAEIRKKEPFMHIPIIVVVNESIEKTKSKFVEYGVTEVWSRPESISDLKERIAEYIIRLVHPD